MMRKYFLLLSTFLFVALGSMAQKTSHINKAPGDTLYYQDFDSTGNFANNGVPLGWTVTNNTTTGPAWEWADSSGTTLSPPIVSPSDTNGFLRLVFPPPPIVSSAVDSYVSSGPITISPKNSVVISWYQSMAYCCSSSSELVLELSTDSINWTTLDATNSRGSNTLSPNGERMSLNVSNVFGNQSTVYIRFRWTGSTQYYWMIDDLLIEEGFTNALSIEDFRIDFHDSTTSIQPMYTRAPVRSLTDLKLNVKFQNDGSNTIFNTYLDVELYEDFLCDSMTAGAGLVFSRSDTLTTSLAFNRVGEFADIDIPYFLLEKNHYRLRFEVYTDSINQSASSLIRDYRFYYGDTIFAKDRGLINQSWSPKDFNLGGNQGDFVGEIFMVDSIFPPLTTSSISVYIPNNPAVIGVSLIPRIYEFDENAAPLDSAIGPVIATSNNSTLITSSMLGGWVNLLLPFTSLTNNSYLVGVAQTSSTSNSQYLIIGRDTSVEKFANNSSGIVFLNSPAGANWGFVNRNTAVRLNIFPSLLAPSQVFCISVNIKDIDDVKEFSLYPNPTNGLLNLDLGENRFQQLEIRNTLGALVYQNNIIGQRMELDLSHLEKGLYFVSLLGDNSREMKKVILQ